MPAIGFNRSESGVAARAYSWSWLATRIPRFIPVAALFLIAALRIASIYFDTPQTYDEPAHLACGMELLATGKYELETQHPPLTRVSAAALPYCYARLQHRPPMPDRNSFSPLGSPIPEWMWIAGNRILGEVPQYIKVLTLARIPNLLFFAIGCVALWLWTEHLFGRLAAACACTLFTTLPIVLAHAAIATTDVALMSFFTLTLFFLTIWIESPTTKRTLGLGLSLGLLVLSKFSVFAFLPACVIALALLPRVPLNDVWNRARLLCLTIVTAAVVIWAGFRFSVAPVVQPHAGPHSLTAHALGRFPLVYALANRVIESPVPAPELFRGLVWLYSHAQAGHPAYLLGQTSKNGWWYFFPVVLGVKTPLAFIVLAILGSVFLLRRCRSLPWSALVPLACSLAILAVAMASKINLGARHVLPLFPLAAIVAGYALSVLLQSRSRAVAACAAGLLVGQLCSSVLAHPNYLGYTNLLAGSRPERILVGSDLDWGQDLFRLRQRLAQLHVQHLALAYSGSADVAALGFPQFHELSTQPAPGWTAVSLTWRKLNSHPIDNPHSPYDWLDRYTPVERIGTSYLLYNIPAQVEPNR